MDFLNQIFTPTLMYVILLILVIIIAWLSYKYIDLRDSCSPEKMRNKQILSGITSIIDKLEGYDNNPHAIEVAKISRKIGKALGFNDYELENLRIASLLHDVGEILLTSDIMSSNDIFDVEMQEILHMHPQFGEKYLKKYLSDLDEVPSIIRWHHERWDGLGYPDNLKGEEIPKSARILALADAVSAMSHHREYRGHQYANSDEILFELESQAGLQFDPDLVKLWSSLVRKEAAEAAAKLAQQEAVRVQQEIQNRHGINVDFTVEGDETK